ncbi:phosphoglyceromutase [Sporocytophaga myxococcoides]|uniref:2,3-bisphosphoglycerate-dependent phosphoglycerate mutase n=1 Tax=Sporocytophaga myxococcoides TaxID=153721 RepID=A0A098LB91_9BACT|nr:2,3-bisphosphoglycerate-dependent phosphoglycerate mutase [Sporocytophaga myxococcoides]GAL84185.1 phosphoglyceromutase [Sporocytophaga myxococcoides]
MAQLIIVRHGQSVWNLENRFTGMTDVDLTPLGREEAKQAGILLKPYNFEIAFTSVLRRAIETLNIILRECDKIRIPVFGSPALNERHYGDLQGLNKKQTELKYGEQQFLLWRRSYDVAPPHGESLKDTRNRVVPYYQKEIESKLKAGKNILISAHGNSLRALMMYMENISPEEIPNITLATGVPRVYEFDQDMKVLKVFNL